MRNRRVNIILVLIMLFGIVLMLYPFISNTLHERRTDKIIVESRADVENMEDEKIQNMLKEAREYNEGIKTTVILSDPFDTIAENQTIAEYYEILNMNEHGLMGYIEIPRLDVYEAIYHGTSDVALANGIGHLQVSSFPIGGEGTHAVLSAHTGLPQAELFTNLPEMKEGDIFYIHILNETLAYQVDQIKTVEPHDTKDIQIVEGEDYVTLITCTPYGLNTHRLLVRGTRVEYTEEIVETALRQKKEGIEKEQWSDNYFAAIIKGAVLGVLLIVVLLVVYAYFQIPPSRRKRRKKRKDNKGKSE